MKHTLEPRIWQRKRRGPTCELRYDLLGNAVRRADILLALVLLLPVVVLDLKLFLILLATPQICLSARHKGTSASWPSLRYMTVECF
jgi:hypothetical protein